MGRIGRKLRAGLGRFGNKLRKAFSWLTQHKSDIQRKYQQGKDALTKYGGTISKIGDAVGGKTGGTISKIGGAVQDARQRIEGYEDKAKKIYHAAGGR